MSRTLGLTSDRDTIVARATPAGMGAIAILRLSGKEAHGIAGKLFRPRHRGHSIDSTVPGMMTLGTLYHPDTQERLDECLLVKWVAPHSYTGEDCIEFHLHGSPLICAEMLSAIQRLGARLATPGEFTQRAYLNGKLDLSQAEAICDLISSRTAQGSRLALQQLNGGLSNQFLRLRGRLVQVVAELEAYVDFPEEGLGLSVTQRLVQELSTITCELTKWAQSANRGIVTREGARVLLAGKPNAGKSSLFNALLGRERAIVTPHPGTTRDTLEAEIDLEGVPVLLVDTAGLREATEEVERIGIERTREELEKADLILFLQDPTDPNLPLEEYQLCAGKRHLVVINKADQLFESVSTLPTLEGHLSTLRISARTRQGVPDLEQQILLSIVGTEGESESVLITNRRHRHAVEESIECLKRGTQDLSRNISPEFVLVDLMEAIAQLDLITGRDGVDEEILDQIFSTFCLGK
ncbi:MAG: tRNA uridine-5-carboxymethylaminomethyl(34) synthesis GTPase MnmE [Candidatus Sumerlaeia bacterium]|nr:tRNA uridine-5-carboxymethylaminomethyl(34) synthesis GTPase MnmE [Candidatus Sumerlaeia bacterium]